MNGRLRWRALILLGCGILFLVAAGVRFASAYRWDPADPFYLNEYYQVGFAYLVFSAMLFAACRWFCSTAPASGKASSTGPSIVILTATGTLAVIAFIGSPWGFAYRGLYERLFLAAGQPAPEIDGEDIDGVPFKLSDYPGKVVVLTFWGFW